MPTSPKGEITSRAPTRLSAMIRAASYTEGGGETDQTARPLSVRIDPTVAGMVSLLQPVRSCHRVRSKRARRPIRRRACVSAKVVLHRRDGPRQLDSREQGSAPSEGSAPCSRCPGFERQQDREREKSGNRPVLLVP